MAAKHKILLLDDDEQMLDLYQEILKDLPAHPDVQVFGAKLGLDLVKNPDLMLQSVPSARFAATYWQQRNLQSACDGERWVDVRKGVQGGIAGLERLVQIATGLVIIARQRGFA